MDIIQSLLEAYVAPEMAAQKKQQHEENAPKRTADAWASIMEQVKPKPDVAGSMYSAKDASNNDVLSALTQSLPAQQAHQQLSPKLSPAERIQTQLDLMMRSGDPALQKRALELVGKDPVAPKMSASARIASDIGLTPGTPEFNQFVKSHAMKIEGGNIKSGYLTKEEKTKGGFDPGSNMVWKSGVPTHIKSSSFTEANQKAAMFADTMQGAEADMQVLMESGYDPTTIQQQLGAIPLVGSHLTTGQQQLMNRAQNGWVRAKLRDESGATIQEPEMAQEREVYFPQPGDGPLVIAAKKRARDLALKGMTTKSGGKFKPYTKGEREAMRDVVRKQIEDAKKLNIEDLSWIPEGYELVEGQ